MMSGDGSAHGIGQKTSSLSSLISFRTSQLFRTLSGPRVWFERPRVGGHTEPDWLGYGVSVVGCL